jgi:hypothetical protein
MKTGIRNEQIMYRIDHDSGETGKVMMKFIFIKLNCCKDDIRLGELNIFFMSHDLRQQRLVPDPVLVEIDQGTDADEKHCYSPWQ